MRIKDVLLLSLILSACVPEPVEEQSTSQTENELAYYFELFEIEAAKRNLPINLDAYGLTASISNIHADNVVGTCSYSMHSGREITIDEEFWSSAGSTDREMVVFHELGHCVLAQGHREFTDSNNNCLSIMASGTQGCRLLYNSINRDYYLDELFLFDSN